MADACSTATLQLSKLSCFICQGSQARAVPEVLSILTRPAPQSGAAKRGNT